MSPRRHAFALALCALIIWGAANLAVAVFARDARIDISQDRVASLSPAVAAALDQLPEPIVLTLVFSRDAARDHPAMEAHGLRVREYLRQLAARSRGMVRLTEIDPRPGSAAEEAAKAAGLAPLAEGPRGPVHLSLTGVNAVDERAVAAPLTPLRAAELERDVVALLARLESAHLPADAAAAAPLRPAVDRALPFAAAQGEARDAGLQQAQRRLLLIHGALAPGLLLLAGYLVRRGRARMGSPRT